MASVKIVRAGAKAAKRKKAPPRLAVIKLDGRDALKSAAPKSVDLERALVGAAMMCGVAVAGAAFIGGSLLDVRNALAAGVDGAAAAAGFAVADLQVEGVQGLRADEVRSVALPQGARSLFAADPTAVKARVEGLDWVEDARVARRWPGEVRIEVTRRRAVARWSVDGAVSVIDAAGERVHGASVSDYEFLPLVVGEGAGPAAAPVLAALEQAPDLRRRMSALIRVNDRRFDLDLTEGPTIALSADSAPASIALAARLQAEHRLLDRPLDRIDLRTPGRAVLTPRAAASASGA